MNIFPRLENFYSFPIPKNSCCFFITSTLQLSKCQWRCSISLSIVSWVANFDEFSQCTIYEQCIETLFFSLYLQYATNYYCALSYFQQNNEFSCSKQLNGLFFLLFVDSSARLLCLCLCLCAARYTILERHSTLFVENCTFLDVCK